jgi:spermidine synthase
MTIAAGADGRATARVSAAALLFPAAVFLSAALVFAVEPMLGRLLLPQLGGSPAIWNTSLAFFQAALLAGYGYAHLLQKIGSVRRQMGLHVLALAAGALCLPLRITGLLGAPWTAAPALWLVLTLAVSVGLPFAVLSATAPLLQAWSARAHRPRARQVYGLYAASNLGSLIALAAYPALAEPLLGLKSQAQLWSLAYAGFGLLMLACGAAAWRSEPAAPAETPALSAPTAGARREQLAWVLLAAAPSSLLLGVTVHITSDVASAPFLWVLPLELYLLTFVIAFARRAAGPPGWLLLVQAILTPLALAGLVVQQGAWPQQLALHLGAFFVTALACHLTLAGRRPPAGRLTEFYFCLSLGGVLGGAFNAFLAPVLFDRVIEYPVVLVLAVLAWPQSPERMQIRERGWFVAGLVCAIPLFVPHLHPPAFLHTALLWAPGLMGLLLRPWPRALVVLWAAIAAAGQAASLEAGAQHFRSFFGVVQIYDSRADGLGPVRIMVHGVTLHGVQALDPARRCTPTSYYAPATLIGGVFRTEQAIKPALRMGVVGLGAGTVATFVRPQDRMRFFELDPMVARLAEDPRRFSFLHGCARGPVDVVTGDARLSMRRERPGRYDLILVDAFSSDSIPTHLLTVEALRGYLRLIKPDGLVLLHLSNRNLDLSGPAEGAAKAAGAAALYGQHWVYADTSPYVEASGEALLLARDPRALEPFLGDPDWKEATQATRPWTDDYTNVWGAMVARLRNPYG